MASGGAALLLCAFLLLSIAHHPASSFPENLQPPCKGNERADTEGLPSEVHHFRCNYSRLEIQLAEGAWFEVLWHRRLEGMKLELVVEDPSLSSMLANTACDFLCQFQLPGPPFVPPDPQTMRDHFLDCNKSDYSPPFCEWLGESCASTNLHRKSDEFRKSDAPAHHKACPPGPPGPPALIWKLSSDSNDQKGGVEFNLVSVGFSRRVDRSCFVRIMTEGPWDSAQAGYCTYPSDSHMPHDYSTNNWTATNVDVAGPGAANKKGKEDRRVWVMVLIAGAIILASLLYLRCRYDKIVKGPSSSTLSSQTASIETPSCREKAPGESSIIYPTHVFRYHELHEATNGFNPSNELGEGGHGSVYRGTLPDGRIVAVKRLYGNIYTRGADLFLNEISILSSLRHPNLVALYGCTTRHSHELLLVYEFVPNGTIADHLHGHRAAEGALAWPLRLRIAVETATALAYLHALRPPVIHRDVKTCNILLDGDFRVKVGDFGLSRLFPAAASHVSTVPQGTPGYVDPEYHRCYQLTDKSDVYSFGVVLMELISSKPALDITRQQHEISLSDMAISKIQNGALQELVDTKLGSDTDQKVRKSIEQVAELAMWCLQEERQFRPTMGSVLTVLLGTVVGLQNAETGRVG
ncbi:hypothetical protein Taro_045387 [Colocasia esculenta]|uniref:Protein kinase domain-containing protein n=1 Tax=Colocasia esculenta TaxID=4460 RepID=A0A843WWH1_COLES|nr:hypothetical protein [Colocasia esculenta]